MGWSTSAGAALESGKFSEAERTKFTSMQMSMNLASCTLHVAPESHCCANQYEERCNKTTVMQLRLHLCCWCCHRYILQEQTWKSCRSGGNLRGSGRGTARGGTGRGTSSCSRASGVAAVLKYLPQQFEECVATS